MNPPRRLALNTREERYAAATVRSAQQVLEEIELLRRRLNDGALSASSRRQAKGDLLEASERLCNLMALAVYQITHGVNIELQGRLKEMLDGLRDRLLDMGIHLMVEKLEKIHDRAEAVLRGGGYPIGLAARLDQAFANIVGNLRTLHALERLGDKDRQLIDQTSAEIKTLSEIEEKLGVLVELDDDGPPPGHNLQRKKITR